MNQPIFHIITYCFFLCLACGEGEKNATVDSATPGETTTAGQVDKSETASEETTIATKAPSDQVLAWVDKLNIRAAPNTKSEVLAQVKENEPLTLTGEQTDFTETIELRGITYTEPWVKVKTTDGKTGWVFQGAVKRFDEEKGTALNTVDKFTYPHFGAFDLTTWKKLPNRDDSGEEVDVLTEVYKKSDRIFEISTVERGEFYYGKTYTLLDDNKKILKERVIDISVDVDYNKLTETIKDYTSKPPKQYTRSQDLKQHFSRMKTKLDMAKGAWKESTIKKTLGETTTQLSIGTFVTTDCKKTSEEDAGCFCSYGINDPYKGPRVFVSDMSKNACVEINGQILALISKYTDYSDELKGLSKSKYWMTLNKDGSIQYFGKSLESFGYEEERDFLVDVLLATDKMPDVIPIENKYEGMAIREVRDNANGAIAVAKKIKTKGDSSSSSRSLYANDQYEVLVRAKNITEYEGESDTYIGLMVIKSKDGKVLESQKVKGNCGC